MMIVKTHDNKQIKYSLAVEYWHMHQVATLQGQRDSSVPSVPTCFMFKALSSGVLVQGNLHSTRGERPSTQVQRCSRKNAHRMESSLSADCAPGGPIWPPPQPPKPHGQHRSTRPQVLNWWQEPESQEKGVSQWGPGQAFPKTFITEGDGVYWVVSLTPGAVYGGPWGMPSALAVSALARPSLRDSPASAPKFPSPVQYFASWGRVPRHHQRGPRGRNGGQTRPPNTPSTDSDNSTPHTLPPEHPCNWALRHPPHVEHKLPHTNTPDERTPKSLSRTLESNHSTHTPIVHCKKMSLAYCRRVF